MALEDELAKHTAALTENTAALKEVAALLQASNEGRQAAVEKITAAAGDAPAASRRGRGPKNSAGGEAEGGGDANSGGAGGGDAGGQADAPKNTAPKAATADDLRAAAEKFMQVTDETVKGKRRAFIKSVIDHFGANPESPGFIGAVPPEHYGAAIDWLSAKTADPDAAVTLPAKAAPAEDDGFEIG